MATASTTATRARTNRDGRERRGSDGAARTALWLRLVALRTILWSSWVSEAWRATPVGHDA
jgi:hypothetical protein